MKFSSAGWVPVILVLAALPAAAQEGNEWTLTAPTDVGAGAAIVATDADILYLAVGRSTRLFYRFTISTLTWEVRARVPATVVEGGRMTHRPGSSFIYVIPGIGQTAVHRYDTVQDQWLAQALEPLPAIPEGPGVQLVATADRLYYAAGRLWESLFNADGTLSPWTEMALPAGIAELALTCLIYPGEGNHLFGVNGAGTDVLRYTIGGSWTSVGNVPAGGRLQGSGPATSLYGTSDASLFRYDLGNNLSVPLADFGPAAGLAKPEGPGPLFILEGAGAGFRTYSLPDDRFSFVPTDPVIASNRSLVGAGDGDRLYVLLGNYFSRYSASSDEWTELEGFGWPDYPGEGAALAHDGGDFVYAVLGNRTDRFWRYSIPENHWSPMVPISGGIVGHGGRLVFAAGRLYAWGGTTAPNGGSGRNLFHRYDTGTGTWDSTSEWPGGGDFYAGTSIAYPGYGDLLYVLAGGTRQFWTYSLANDDWERLDDLPAEARSTTMLASFPGGDDLYALFGPPSLQFWKYSIADDAWTRKAQPHSVSLNPEALASSGGNSGDLYLLRGGVPGLLRYSTENYRPVLTSIGQYRMNGTTPIAAGASTNEPRFILKISALDQDGQPCRMEIEIKPSGIPLDGSAAQDTGGFVTEADFSVTVDAVTGAGYHWQARVTDSRGSTSGWIGFGSVFGGVDIVSVANLPPTASSVLQRSEGSGEIMAAGATHFGPRIRLEALVADPNDDDLRWEVEVVPAGTSFRGAATASVLSASGLRAVVAAPLPPGSYSWRHRTLDPLGLATPWISFGGNAEGEADFRIAGAGSTNGKSCLQSAVLASPAPLVWFLLGATAFLLARKSTRRLGFHLLPAALLSISCGPGGGAGSSPGPAAGPVLPPPPRLVIDPDAVSFLKDESVDLGALEWINGSYKPADVEWSTSAVAIVSITPEGTATGESYGSVTITARLKSERSITARATITVTPPLVLGAGADRPEFVIYSGDGATRTPLVVTDESDVPLAMGSCSGLAMSRTGAYVIFDTRILRVDLTTGRSVLVAAFPEPHKLYSLAIDPSGRFYTIDAATFDVVRYSPDAGWEAVARLSGVSLPTGLQPGPGGTLYTQDFLSPEEAGWIFRIDPDLVDPAERVKRVANDPREFEDTSFGFCAGPAGVLFAASVTAVYRCEEVAPHFNGDFLDPGERVECAAGFGRIDGLCWTESGVLVNDSGEDKIVLLKNLNNDKDFNDPGEREDWASPGIINWNFTPSLQARRPENP